MDCHTIHDISMKCTESLQSAMLCHEPNEAKPPSHDTAYEKETVGDCVLIKLQSYFFIVSSDCWYDWWTQWLFIVVIVFESFFFFLSSLRSFVLCCVAFTIERTIAASNGYDAIQLLSWYYPKAWAVVAFKSNSEFDCLILYMCNTVNISHCKWNNPLHSSPAMKNPCRNCPVCSALRCFCCCFHFNLSTNVRYVVWLIDLDREYVACSHFFYAAIS